MYFSFPRTRGDVPGVNYGYRESHRLPPHSRGCTAARGPIHALATASPALAGMYPIDQSRASDSTSFPRTRGDVPMAVAARTSGVVLPPHSRGCTAQASAEGCRRCASPALAGMYLNIVALLHSTANFPRTRGDVPDYPNTPKNALLLPPHSRGCTVLLAVALPTRHASPALAGMYLRVLFVRICCHGFPRTRGDVPLAKGASYMRRGENGRGLLSRWYPETLAQRLVEIQRHADKLIFREGDGMELLPSILRGRGKNAAGSTPSANCRPASALAKPRDCRVRAGVRSS